MTDALKKLIVDIETGTQQYVDLTSEEIAEREASVIAHSEQKAAEEAAAAAKAALKESAKAKLIAGESLTAEEADVLVI